MRKGTILFPSDSMCRQIAADVQADYQRACENAARTIPELRQLTRERVEKEFAEEKADRKTIESLKPSLLQWLLPRVR